MTDPREKIRDLLLKEFVTEVIIDFSGSGDSGCINDIDIIYADGHEPKEENKHLSKMLEEYAYSWLDQSGIDWCNNDGGQGEIKFDLRSVPFQFEAYIDQNWNRSETVYSAYEAL